MRASVLASLGAASVFAVITSACGGTVKGTAATTGSGGSTGAGGAPTTVANQASATSSSSSGAQDAGSDVDNGMVSTNYPAPHPAAPQVITAGGPVLAMPKLVPVFFSNDGATMVQQIADFVNKVGATQYWAATTSEYGVGPATAASTIMLNETAPTMLDDATIQTWLAGKLNGNDPAWPAADDNTIYLLHYPSGTSITLQTQNGTEASCTTFGGYHNSITLDANHGSQNVAYAVVPRCFKFGNLTGIDAVTSAESHEIIEAATDPYPMVNPAYAQADDAHLYWLFALGGGEVGDMCAQFPGVFTKFAELPYTVQRTWSNQAAKAGHDPCVPALPGAVYFNTAPVLNDNITIMGVITLKAAKIPVGQSKTIELDLFSDADTGGPWTVQAFDFAQLMGQPQTMSFTLDQSSGQNGQKLHLTIEVMKATQFNADIFLLESSLGNTTNWWLGLVGN
jgi:hypothetical protein